MPGSGALHTTYGYHTHHTPCYGSQKQVLPAQHFLRSPMPVSICRLPFYCGNFCFINSNSAAIISTNAYFPTLVILHSSSTSITFLYLALSSVLISTNSDGFSPCISTRCLLKTESGISPFKSFFSSSFILSFAYALLSNNTFLIP